MQKGVYELLVSRRLEQLIDRLPTLGLAASVAEIDIAERAGVLSDSFARTLKCALHEAHSAADPNRQLRVYNSLVEYLQTLTQTSDGDVDTADAPARQLRLVWPDGQPNPGRPDSPLATGTLLTGTRLDPSLVSQLRKELETADQVDILCSFIKWGGIRVLEDDLRQFTARPGSMLRVITTSFLGATDLKAVEFLRALPNTTVRVSYDTHRTRLHAKAYIMRRNSGFGSAYIGSANLSQAALTDGLEWTVKVSQYEQSYLWKKATATFETYWNDAEFEHYEAGDRERLDAALQRERGGSGDEPITYFDLRPYAFQQEILDKIEAERDLQARDRHLIVAATGTEKTWSRHSTTNDGPRHILRTTTAPACCSLHTAKRFCDKALQDSAQSCATRILAISWSAASSRLNRRTYSSRFRATTAASFGTAQPSSTNILLWMSFITPRRKAIAAFSIMSDRRCFSG